MSEGLSSEELIDSLNTYFDAVVGTIYEQGGEVLKYIGDAILAVFPVENLMDRSQACAAALAAVDASAARLDELNRKRDEQGQPLFHHGVGLHLAVAQYGNIGSRERLDFTVIGREVNLASRVAGMCKALDQPVLASVSFANEAPSPMQHLGSYALQGIAGAVPLFGRVLMEA